MKRLSVPVAHLNGNTAADLTDSYCEALFTLNRAADALRSGDGLNMRNYYQRADGEAERATALKQNAERIEKIVSVVKEIEAIVEAVIEGRDHAEVEA